MKDKAQRNRYLLPASDPTHREASELEVRQLLHELQVHSEEITVQNEQLLKAQAELEHARDRYADLYDFAPVGYLSLDHRGAVVEINLQGALLLGRARAYLIGLPLVTLIARADRERYRQFLIRGAQAHHGAAPDVEVRTKREPPHTLRLIAKPQGTGAGAQVFIALLDVTEERRLAREREELHAKEQARLAELQRENAVRLAAENRARALFERLVDVQEHERRRIALNLHDQLGQQLTALKLTLGALREEKLSAAERRTRFAMVDSIVAQLDRDVDFLAWELRPAALDAHGLEAALEQFVRQWSSARGIPAELHGRGSDAARLPADVETQLYRVSQEALNNVAKHAEATHVSVLLERRADEVRLIVEDDGAGFDPDSGPVRHGMGLAGMRERVTAVGGSVEVESAPGEGTTVFVRIPLPPPAEGS